MQNKRKRYFVVFIIILCVVAILFGVFRIQDMVLKMIYPQKYAELVNQYAEENDLDPLLVFAIIKAESNFDEDVISNSGAVGLMQLMESTAQEMADDLAIEIPTKESLFDPELNIQIGTYYFAYLLGIYEGNIYLALTAYNAGIGNVNTWIEEGTIREDGSDIENIPYKETNNYVRKIVRDYRIYQDLYEGGGN